MKCKLYITVFLVCYSQIACDYIDVDVPDNRIDSEKVFSKDETANSAVIGIYNELFRSAFSNGFQESVTVLADLSSDNLQATYANTNLLEFEENEIFPGNSTNLSLWSSAYKIIYMTNAVTDGLNNSNGVSPDLKAKLLGEVKFIRAFTYFYLVNLYGEVPLILSVDYRTNAIAERSSVDEVYLQIVEDLEESMNLLKPDYENGERLRANKLSAVALLARVQLYLEDWGMAEELSSQIILDSQNFRQVQNLEEVFLANSEEAIWQISPHGGGSSRSNTLEGEFFIMLDQLANVAMTGDLISIFSTEDSRLEQWIGSFDTGNDTLYFPFKYKIKIDTGNYSEYSMVLRLAEQYLIRAEARARQGKLIEAINDLNLIRERANLELLSNTSTDLHLEALLDLIMEERRRELFAEWGHRWLDLKRMGKASQELSQKKHLWQNTDIFYPIPQDEIRKNPNLTQNPGY